MMGYGMEEEPRDDFDGSAKEKRDSVQRPVVAPAERGVLMPMGM